MLWTGSVRHGKKRDVHWPTCGKSAVTIRNAFAVSLSLAALLGGCASHVRLNSGATGLAMPANATISFIGTHHAGGQLARQAQASVAEALEARGHKVGPDAPVRIEVGLTNRPSVTGVSVIDGAVLSPPKGKAFLQSCRDRTYRLVLTYYGAGETVPVTRAWAEERHCKGTIDDSIRSLADKAVAALATGSSTATIRRRAVE
jgi:hypothetical protein